MSRVARNSIKIPEGTSYTFDKNIFTVKGKNGEISISIDKKFTIKSIENEINVLPLNEKDKLNPTWGTTRAHVNNSITGVNSSFSKTLELNGTGYRASISGNTLKLQLGYSHDIDFNIPKNIKIECPKQNIINITINLSL